MLKQSLRKALREAEYFEEICREDLYDALDDFEVDSLREAKLRNDVQLAMEIKTLLQTAIRLSKILSDKEI